MRVGIIGAGTMGAVHARAYLAAGQEIASVYDPRVEVAAALAGQVGATVAETLGEMYGDDIIDIISVCTPTYLHREYVEQAAIVGKHVICEAPIALTLADARSMIDLCWRAGVELYVAHGHGNTVHRPAVDDDWRLDPARSGGPMVDLLIHEFDRLRRAHGDVATVEAVGPDSVLLQFAGGQVVRVDAAPGGGGQPDQQAYTELIRHFLHSIETGDAPRVTPEDAYQALAIALAARRSAESGRAEAVVE